MNRDLIIDTVLYVAASVVVVYIVVQYFRLMP